MPRPSPEWGLQTMLKNGFAYLRQYPELVDVALEGYAADIRAEVKAYIAKHRAMEVVINYPKREQAVPFISIFTGRNVEAANKDALGDILGADDVFGDWEDADGVEHHNEKLQQTMRMGYAADVSTDITITTEDGNMTLYMFDVMRFLLFTHKLFMDTNLGMLNTMFNIRDYQFDPSRFPTFAYSRMLTLTYALYYDVNVGAATRLPAVKAIEESVVAPYIHFFELSLLEDDPLKEGIPLQNFNKDLP